MSIQITKKMDDLKLEDEPPKKDAGWRGLVEDALGGIEFLDDEDESPFIPGKGKMEKGSKMASPYEFGKDSGLLKPKTRVTDEGKLLSD